MNKESRIQYLSGLINDSAHVRSTEIWYKGQKQRKDVYEIDLNYLIYNSYNGRIASAVKTYEKESGNKLNSSIDDDKKIIEDFLWNSSITSNKNTRKNIEEQGQMKYGIVTKDGVIIDGNRRALILIRIAEDKNENPYFLATILDEELDQNVKEIMRLETTYQMGEDAKVDYNPIEKYLKCKDLLNNGFDHADIAKMMGENKSEIEKYESIMKLMDDYLDKLNYSEIYTRLEKTEGTFVDIDRYLKTYLKGSANYNDWSPEEEDINELKLIYFDYIRYTYNRPRTDDDLEDGIMASGDSKDYRFIGQTSKRGSIFQHNDIWERFKENHFNNIDQIRDNEKTIDELKEENPGRELKDLLKSRDQTFASDVAAKLKQNLGRSRDVLNNKIQSNQPYELLIGAYDKLSSINSDDSSFNNEDSRLMDIVKKINTLIWNMKRKLE